MISFETILIPLGLNTNKRIRLVRHQDKRFDIEQLYRNNQIEIYQEYQSKPVFLNSDIIISFIGKPNSHAQFVGVYDILDCHGPTNFALPIDFIYQTMGTDNCYKYNLQRDQRFDELKRRLIVDWGSGTRSWVQHYKPCSKELVEIRPLGYAREFSDYMNVILNYTDLVEITSNAVTNKDWHSALKSVAGIYMILDTKTGKQYIGSAYGENGILGRWITYAKTRHGDNKQLAELLDERPDAIHDFRYSILQIVSTSLTPREVIKLEAQHKEKLGSRAHGLNSN